MSIQVLTDRYRVRLIHDHPDGNQYLQRNDLGTVLAVNESTIVVQWDKFCHGHDGINQLGKYGYCWNVLARNIIKIQEEWDI